MIGSCSASEVRSQCSTNIRITRTAWYVPPAVHAGSPLSAVDVHTRSSIRDASAASGLAVPSLKPSRLRLCVWPTRGLRVRPGERLQHPVQHQPGPGAPHSPAQRVQADVRLLALQHQQQVAVAALRVEPVVGQERHGDQLPRLARGQPVPGVEERGADGQRGDQAGVGDLVRDPVVDRRQLGVDRSAPAGRRPGPPAPATACAASRPARSGPRRRSGTRRAGRAAPAPPARRPGAPRGTPRGGGTAARRPGPPGRDASAPPATAPPTAAAPSAAVPRKARRDGPRRLLRHATAQGRRELARVPRTGRRAGPASSPCPPA